MGGVPSTSGGAGASTTSVTKCPVDGFKEEFRRNQDENFDLMLSEVTDPETLLEVSIQFE